MVDQAKTKRSDAQAGLNQLHSLRAHLLGVVLNRAALPSTETHYAYGKKVDGRSHPQKGRRRAKI